MGTPEGVTLHSPAPEGVHQDGADFVLIIFVDKDNVAPRGGESRVYDLGQKSGVLSSSDEEEARRSTRLAEKNMCTPFEMLVLDDRAVKHDNRQSATKEDMKAPLGSHPHHPLQLRPLPEDA